MLSSDFKTYRQVFFDAWKKHTNGETLSPLEQQIVAIISSHPEYQYYFTDPEKYLDMKFSVDDPENPFLHIAMHQAVLDQVSVDRPQGIREIYQRLQSKLVNQNEVEHFIAERLVRYIYRALNENKPFDEKAYLEALQQAMLE